MIDDPNKELKRLEEQLLKAEMTDDDLEAFYDELIEEFGSGEGEKKPAAEQVEIPVEQPRQYRAGGQTPYGGDLDEELYAPKKKGIKGLVICACAECLGIVAIVLWWALKIL